MGYYDILRQQVRLDGERVTIHTKDGLPPWDEIESAVTLLAEGAAIPPGARVLVLESGSGALAVLAARRGAEVHCYDGSLIACRMTRQTLESNGVAGQVYDAVCPPPSAAGTFDLALLVVPKGRAYTRALLGGAARALKPGARLYLAGANAAGAKAIVKDAGAILGRSATVRTRARARLGRAVRLGSAPGSPAPEAALPDVEAAGLKLTGAPGVFSWDALDDGTASLLATLNAELCARRRVLDVGCGSGAIGLTAAKLGAVAVDMIDVAWLAVECARLGIRANGLGEVCRAWPADLYADVPDGTYDLILSNPPFHSGQGVETAAVEALISGAHERLAEGGRLRLVANVFLPYEALLGAAFGARRVRIVAEDARYRVLEAGR